ncbi:MAG: undecaprenyl-diphosphatase UppP [Candidatus Moranbacteria bacterium]|nr:undecaprenyl-diphosphatase UppP [Candidatus Moranbacteria bacterium]
MLYALILGLIQGLGEFLPISSSGHLVIAHQLFNLNLESVGDSDLALDTALHFGTLLAVVYYFRKELIKRWKRLWQLKDQKKHRQERNFFYLMAIATIPGALAGILLDDLIENYARTPIIVAGALVGYGILLLIADVTSKAKNNKIKLNKKLTLGKAVLIGIAQALALVPGTSRSGITITAGLFLGLSRKQAAKFSFLLSIPIIAGASLVQLPKLYALKQINMVAVSVAIFVSALTGFLAIKYMLKYLQKRGYYVFVIYRIIIAVIIWQVAS